MRNKKNLTIILFALLPLLVGLACTCGLLPFGRDKPVEEEIEVVVTDVTIVEEIIVEEPDVEEIFLEETVVDETTVEETPVEEIEEVVIPPGEELIAFDFTWLQEERDVFVAFYLKNQYQDKNLERIDYHIRLLDSEGEEIRSEKRSFLWLFPDQTVGVGFRAFLAEDAPPVETVTLDFEYRSSSPSNGFLNPFSVEKMKIWDSGSGGRPTLTAIIQNNSSTIYTDVRVNYLCLDATGNIICGGHDILRFVPGQGGMIFKETPVVYGEVATIEIHPIITLNSKTIEDTPELWESISVIDHYYEEYQFRNIYGGLMIKNNLEDVAIKQSYAVMSFYDQEGNVTTYSSVEIPLLLPGSILGIAPYVYAQPPGSTTTSYDWIILPGEQIDDFELQENVFSVNSTELTGSSNQYVLVNFTNTYNKSASQVIVFVMLYDENGLIIGGGRSTIGTAIDAGAIVEEEVYISYPREVTIADIEAWVLPTSWTRFE